MGAFWVSCCASQVPASNKILCLNIGSSLIPPPTKFWKTCWYQSCSSSSWWWLWWAHQVVPWWHSTPRNEWVLAWQLCALVAAHPQAEQGCSAPVQSLGTQNEFPLIFSVEETLMDLSLTSEWIASLFAINHLVPAGNKLLALNNIMLHLKK